MNDITNAASHTPGPWEVVPSGNKSMTPCTIRSSFASGHLYVAEIKCPHGCDGRHERDARLISQAPKLLESIILAIGKIDDNNPMEAREYLEMALESVEEGK